MLNKIFKTPVEKPEKASILSPQLEFPRPEDYNTIVQRAINMSFQIKQPLHVADGRAMDASFNGLAQYEINYPISPELISWYGSQGFIGYQLCAIIAQNWLVREGCFIPARDAIKKGFEITVNDGTRIKPEINDAFRQADIKYRLHDHLRNFIGKGRVFGIRIVMFKVDIKDHDERREYYENPFNPDGIKPNSYLGMTQIDPYWITPELDSKSAGDPSSLYFYEPTWWRVNGMRIHRTHLVIFRTEEVEDILKPTYFYGGIPIPQKAMELVYNTIRISTEIPALVMTKRLQSLKIDLDAAVGQGQQLQQRMQEWVYARDNFGVKIIGLNEEVQQLDTSLTDIYDALMSEEQLTAAMFRIPVTKLFKTAPKGFDATGEYDETNYHEDLESYQVNDLTPLVVRHHLFVMYSDIAPRFGISPFSTTVTWKPLDTMTAEQLANVNKTNAETAVALNSTGAIDGQDIRNTLVSNPESGYSGISTEAPMQQQEEIDPDAENEQKI
jgi:uncharacterized protein